MGLKLYQVDAFTDDLFSGNPAGVCVVGEDLFSNSVLIRKIAAEMNLSETAFLVKRGEHTYGLRWFTPTMEVPLCGHATLASAHILFETGAEKDDDQILFSTLSGVLRAKRTGSILELDFPAITVSSSKFPDAAMRALGISPVSFFTGGEWALAEVETAEELFSVTPDFSALKKCVNYSWIVTCRSDSSSYDFYSRIFAPAAGIDEDPVTGAAHCVLAPYWSEKLGTTTLRARQVSERGGKLACELSGDRVYLRGSALTVFDIDLRMSL